MKEKVIEKNVKPIIMQHCVASYANFGGPATGYRLLMESKLNEKYQFLPLIQREAPHGINFSLLYDLFIQIRKVKPDIIHIRGLHSEGFYGLLAARLAGCKKIVLSVHGTYTDSLNIGRLKKFLFGKIIEPFTLRNASLVYCVCDFAVKRPYIYKNTKKLYGYIHNAAPDFSSNDSKKARQKIRAELGINPDEIVVVTVGRVTPGKGYKDIVEALKKLRTKINFRYLIVGEGDYLEELKKELSEEIKMNQVIILGKRLDVTEILFASNIFVFPTLHENLSNALLEACAAGLAIIATNVGGNPEVIQNEETGILIPPHSPDILAQEIFNLTTDISKREKLAANAHDYVRINYNKDLIFGQMEKMYDALLQK